MARRSKNSEFENVPKAKLSRENLRKSYWLFGYLKPYRTPFLIGVVAVMITAGTSLAFAHFISEMIGEPIEGEMEPEAIKAHATRVGLIILGLLTAQALITYTRMQLLGRVGERALTDVRRDTYGRLLKLPMRFYGEQRVGEISSRLAADLSLIHDTLISTTPQFIRQMVMLVGGMTLVFFCSTRLAFVMLALLPPIVLAIAFFGRGVRGLSRTTQQRLAETNVVVDETLHGVADVKAFTNEGFETRRYGRGLTGYLDQALKLVGARALMVAFVIFALFGAITFVVWYGANMLANGAIEPTSFFRFGFYTVFVAGAFGALPDLISQLQKAIGATDRLREIIDEETESDESTEESAPKERATGAVAFEDVHFAYPSREDVPVIDGVSFEVEAGKRVALVGPSGAGKSTVVSLLLRFYDPVSGRLVLDGTDLREYPLHWLRKQMAVVPQEVMLFGGSIRENIAYGDPEASEEAIIAAAKKANAHDFITHFPEAYDTLVGERGIKLSGGQRQRIAIARAILADPAVLILDEATSSLDSESERLVQEALDQLMRGRTSIIIAHRLATVRDADRILVLDRGKIVQEGPHEKLMEDHDGLYRMLAQLQLA